MLGDYSAEIVLLSYGISFLGAYVAICSCEQLRGVYLKYSSPPLPSILPWLLLTGLSIGGVAIWSMHFIGMSALSLKDENGNDVMIRYNVGVSIFSMIAAVIAVICGVAIASRDKVFAKSKTDIIDFFLHSVSFEEFAAMTELQILFLLATRSLHQLVIGGAIAGSGVVIMHYIGMAAMEFPGKIHWNAGIIAASIIIAIVAATAAFWIFFRLLSIYPDSEFLRLASAVVMGVAVCGMHYTGMVAADFKVDQEKINELDWKSGAMSQKDSLYSVLFAAMVVLWIFSFIVFADLRWKVSKYRQQLQKMAPEEKLAALLITAEDRTEGYEFNGSLDEQNNLQKVSVKPSSVSPFPN